MYEQARNAPDLMKGFVNTVLGLPFEERLRRPNGSGSTSGARPTASASCLNPACS
jgi:hypothetical protein